MMRLFFSKVVIGVAIGFFLLSLSAHAQSVTPFRVLIYTHTTDPVVRSGYINSYSGFSNVPGASVVYRDIYGMSFDQYQAQLRTDMIAGNNLFIYGGHGSLSDLSTDGVSFTRDYALRAASNVAAENGGNVTAVVESCGSGNVCGVSNLAGEGALDGVYTAANPGDYGYVYNEGGPWYAKFGEQLKGTLSHFGDGTSLDPDVNKDGILTQGELADSLYGANKGNRSQIVNPDEPFAFKDQQTEDEYRKKNSKPCNVGPVYSVVPTLEGACYKLENSLYNKSSKSVLYGPGYLFANPKNSGAASAVCPAPDPAADAKADAAKVASGHVVEIGGYTTRQRVQDIINGKQLVVSGSHAVQVGTETKEQCDFKEAGQVQSVPSPIPQSDLAGNNVPGNGGGTSPAAAGSSGIESLLPLLMQSLLGGGQQGQQGAGSGSSGVATQSCAQQGVFPVCGTDGKTYTNSCYLYKYGATAVSDGACSATQSSGAGSSNVSNVATKLITSGVPQSVINSIISSLSSILARTSGEKVLP